MKKDNSPKLNNCLSPECSFVNITDSLDELIFKTEFPSQKVTFINKTISTAFGYASENFTNGSCAWEDFIHKNDKAKALEDLSKLITSKTSGIIKYRVTTKDNNIKWCLDKRSFVLDQDNNIISMTSIIHDITEQEKHDYRLNRINDLQLFLLLNKSFEKKIQRITDVFVDILDSFFARIWLIKPSDNSCESCVHSKCDDEQHVCKNRDFCLHLLASSGYYTHTKGGAHERVPFGLYKIGKIASEDYPSFITNDAISDDRVHNHAWVKKHSIKSFAGIRLGTASSETLGVLAFFSKKEISKSDFALTKTFAHIVTKTVLSHTQEQQIMHSFAEWTSTFDSITDRVFTLDLEHNIVKANKASLMNWNITQDKVIDTKYYNLIYQANKHWYDKSISQVLKTKQPFIHEVFDKKDNLPLLVSTYPILDDSQNITGFVFVLKNIYAQKLLETKLKDSLQKQKEVNKKLGDIAYYDALTGFINRAPFEKIIKNKIDYAEKNNKEFAILFIDLDKFKVVNDIYGHDIGDKALQKIAGKIKDAIPQNSSLCRLGGDEFLLCSDYTKTKDQIYNIINSILNLFEEELEVNNVFLEIKASIGVAIYSKDSATVEELIKNSDIAMYEAKKSNEVNFKFYCPEQKKELEFKQALSNALINNELILYYQPIVNQFGECVFLEALLRWNSPIYGLVSPLDFIPIIEKNRQINTIGQWIIAEAVKTISKINRKFKNIGVTINLSPIQLDDPTFYPSTMKLINDSSVNRNNVCFEITENENPISKDIDVTKTLEGLRDNNFKLLLDDFGSGFSSINNLIKLPVDIIKLDKFLVNNLKDSKYSGFINDLISMTKKLDYKLVAEGVETEMGFEILKEANCDYFQGYYFSRPVPNIIEVLEKNNGKFIS